MSTSQDEIIEMVDFNTPSTSSKIHKNSASNDVSTINSEEDGNEKKINTTRLPQSSKKINVKKYIHNTNNSELGSDRLEKIIDNSISEHLESPFTNKSEAQSYREKIRDRFQSVKKQAGTSLSKVHQQRSSKNSAIAIIDLKKTLKLVKQENTVVDTELNKYTVRAKLTNLSETEKYTFFCEQLHNQEIVSSEQNLQTNEIIESTELLVEAGIESILINALPTMLESGIKIAEDELLWHPKRTSVSIYSKIKYDEPRFLTDEGLYVPKLPKISYINVLEQRLLCADDKKWFNCDGKLDLFESPLKETSYRPKSNISSFNFNIEYVLPKLTKPDHRQTVLAIPKILTINILNIDFQHHPLFSAEHIFEKRLIFLYDVYKKMLISNNIERINKRLEVIRNCMGKLDNNFQASGDKNKMINTYINEIKELRNRLFNESKQFRENVNEVLQTWRIIKKLRESNKYSNTSIKLLIHKEVRSYEEERNQMQERINQTISEIVIEKKHDYEIKMSQFKEKMEKWKCEKRKNEIDDLPKPKKPILDINEDEIKDDVITKFKQSFKPPGEPILHFIISYDNEITKEVEVEKEQLRQQAVKMTKIFFKISCDNTEVCKSKFVTLNDSFSCFFDDIFPLQLTNIPEHITVEIFEQQKSLLKHKMGETRLNIRDETYKRNEPLKYFFEKEEFVHYSHKGVGSGVNLNTIMKTHGLPTYKNETLLHTSGFVNCLVAWEDSSKNMFEITQTTNLERNVTNMFNDSDEHIDICKLIEWINCMNIDPQDPRNSGIFDYINTYAINTSSSVEYTNKCFRCSPYLQSLKIDVKLIDNIRFKVLELRNRNEPEFLGMTIPNRIKEIPMSILLSYKKRVNDEKRTFVDERNENIDEKRSYGRKYLKQIQTKVFKKCRSDENNLIYEDVVNEKLIPYFENWFKTFIDNFLNWFKIRPISSKPLPKLVNSKFNEIHAECTAPVKLVIHVISAINIPKRIFSRKLSRSQSNIDENSTHNVSTFIEIEFQNKIQQTSVQEGINPKWNEELVFNLESKYVDYLNPNSLNGSIMLNVFEQTVEKLSEKKLKKWLGYIEIPLSTIYYNRKIEGFFQIKSPISLCYDYNANKIQVQSSRSNTSNCNENNMHISLKFQIEPKVPKLTLNMEDLPSSEPPYIHQYILKWNEKHKVNFPDRNFSALAIDLNGKTVCVTRFIKAVEPPQMNIDDFDITPEQCARYVSVIPFSESNKLYDQIWLNTEQMLRIMTGSITDHAIALTCYFLALNIETWLLIGHGTHGVTAYVFILEHKTEDNAPLHFVYDVITGNKYSIYDPLCPLKNIYCVINESNVWANVQRTSDISITQYNFTNKSDWHPLFNNKITSPSNSVQKIISYYTVADIQELEIQFEKKLRKKIAKLRQFKRTIWNHYISSFFKNAVHKAEYNRLLGKQEIVLNAHPIENTHVVHGHIIDLPYKNLSAVIDIIKSSQIINVDITNSEFVLAVHIHPYPNEVFVIWILLGFVIRK